MELCRYCGSETEPSEQSQGSTGATEHSEPAGEWDRLRSRIGRAYQQQHADGLHSLSANDGQLESVVRSAPAGHHTNAAKSLLWWRRLRRGRWLSWWWRRAAAVDFESEAASLCIGTSGRTRCVCAGASLARACRAGSTTRRSTRAFHSVRYSNRIPEGCIRERSPARGSILERSW